MNAEILLIADLLQTSRGIASKFLTSLEKFVKIKDFIFLSFSSTTIDDAAVKRQRNCYGYV